MAGAALTGRRGAWTRVAGTVAGAVAHLAYSYTILNRGDPSTETPPGAPWLGAAMWPIQQAAGIIAAAHQARQADADVVVVSLHWGQEYNWTPTKDQTALAEALLGSPDIDLILGTHVHVVQPCQTVHDKLVFYGLGNSLSNQSSQVDSNLKPQTQDGMIATVTVSRDATGKVTDSATYQPTSVDLNGHVIRLATKTGNPTTWNRRHRGSYGRLHGDAGTVAASVEVLRSSGASTPPPLKQPPGASCSPHTHR
jgi:poly-gamma-glutamate capsule biosynthesis protein CapA/YwtB (metallophosphatase superfamily)